MKDKDYIVELYKERFCILTVDSNDSDQTALRKLRTEFLGLLDEYDLKGSEKSKIINECKRHLYNEGMINNETEPW